MMSFAGIGLSLDQSAESRWWLGLLFWIFIYVGRKRNRNQAMAHSGAIFSQLLKLVSRHDSSELKKMGSSPDARADKFLCIQIQI